jgi:hypothetical protein
MARKTDPDLLASRLRAVTGGAPKPLAASAPPVQTFGAKKPRVALRRKSERTAAFKEALIITETGAQIKVIIKDITERGARVEFHAGGGVIRGRVQLVEPSRGLKRYAQVRWRDQNSAGLEFE